MDPTGQHADLNVSTFTLLRRSAVHLLAHVAQPVGASNFAQLLLSILALLWFTAAPAGSRADTLRLLDGNQEAAQARVDLIQQAEREICVAYYSADVGHVPAVLLSLLGDAAQRGVQVRLLLDGYENEIPPPVWSYLISQGVEIREYHPLRLIRPGWVNRRLHSKLLIVDGDHLVIGSRNLTDAHFGLACVNFVDCDAYVRGCATNCAREYFFALWNSDHVRPVNRSRRLDLNVLGSEPEENEPLTRLWKQSSPEEVPDLLAASIDRLVAEGWLALHTGNDWSAGCPQDLSIRFISDAHLHKRWHSFQADVLQLIDSAQLTLVITTPYVIFSPAVERAVLEARRRDVAVLLLTNSLASSEHTITYAAYENRKQKLLDAGVELWEYAGPDHLHAKIMIVDGGIGMLGSYNFDVRSDTKNLEVAIAVSDPRAATMLSAWTAQPLSRASSPTHLLQHDALPLR